MEQARPLRDVFADLATSDAARRERAADPDGFLDGHGHGDLPDQLVTEAIVNYADVAPAEVAEHLAPFVQAHSAVPVDGPAAAAADAAGLDALAGLDLLAGAPTVPIVDELTVDGDLGGDFAGDTGGAPAGTAADPFDLDFGEGDSAAVVDLAGAQPAEVAGGVRLPDAEPIDEPIDEPVELAADAGAADLPGADLLDAEELPTDGEPTIDE